MSVEKKKKIGDCSQQAMKMSISISETSRVNAMQTLLAKMNEKEIEKKRTQRTERKMRGKLFIYAKNENVSIKS